MMIQEKIRGETLSGRSEYRREEADEAGVAVASAEEVAALTGPFGNSTRQNRVAGLVQTDAADRPEDRVP